MPLITSIVTHMGTTLTLHAVVAFKICYYMSIRDNLPAIREVKFLYVIADS